MARSRPAASAGPPGQTPAILLELDAVLRLTPGPMLAVDGDTGLVTGINARAEDLVGAPGRKSIVGRQFADIFAESRTEAEVLLEVTGDGEVELSIRHADGTHHHVAASASRVVTADHNYVTVLFTDLAKHDDEVQWLRRQLRELDRNYRDFIETGSENFWAMDPDMNFTFTARQPAKSRKVLVAGRPPWEYGLTPIDGRTWEDFKAIIAARQPIREFRFRQLTDLGATLYISVNGRPAYDESGEYLGHRGIATDITGIAEANEALSKSEALLNAVIDAAPVGIDARDRKGRYLFMNRFMAEFFGIDAARAPGRKIEDVHPPERAAAIVELDEHVLLTRKRIEYYEQDVIGADGIKRVFFTTKVPLLDDHENAFAVLNIHLDITERKEQEHTLRQAQKMEAIGRLTGGIAHDFNNLLAVASASLELLNEDTTLSRDQRELVAAAVRACERGADLTERLLSVARRRALAPERVDIRNLVDDAVSMLTRTLGRNVTVDVRPRDAPAFVYVDAGEMQVALVNLAVNARDAMPDGGTITFEIAATVGEVSLSVIDRGTGMSPQVAARALEPFFTTKADGRGSGLGLSMVYAFVEQSQGVIDIESAEGRGTRVTLRFPRA